MNFGILRHQFYLLKKKGKEKKRLDIHVSSLMPVWPGNRDTAYILMGTLTMPVYFSFH